MAVLGHRVEVGAQAHPLDEVGQRVAAQDAHGALLGRSRKLVRAREGVERTRGGVGGRGDGGERGGVGRLGRGSLVQSVLVLVGFGELVDDAQELLDVLDAAARLVGVLGLQRADEAALVDDHLDDLAQIAAVGARLVDEAHELPDGLARRRAQLRVDDGQLGAFHERHAHLAGELLDALDGGLADAAPRHVDDALRRDVVGRVHDEREVGHDVADLGAVEEARAADDAVRHAGAQQHVFQHAALRVRAVEHGHLVVRQPRRALLLDLAGDPAAFIALVGGHVHLDLVAVLGAGEQLLRLAVLVVRDDRVRGRQNVAHAAVVLLELHGVRRRVVLLELEDVAQVGAAPRVDGLVVVAHHHDVLVPLGQKPRDGVLGVVRVLVLVHHDVAEALLVGRPHVLVVLQQQVGVQQKVVEVEGVRGLEALLQAGVHARGHLPHRVARFLLEGARHDELVLRRGDAVHEGVHREALWVDVQLGHDLLVQALLVVGVVDGEVARESQLLGVGAQHAHAHAMERRHPHAAAARAHQAVQALAHLGGRLVRERDGEDLPRSHVVVLDEVRDTVREHARLARAGAGEHEQRPVDGDDRLALRPVQAVDID